ncbi:MAG: 1-hydroxycarotenoid 3,4-desaturase CrtD [Pseudomonadota bacterium]
MAVHQPHVIVIGAGIGGLAAALRLTKMAARVTLIDAGSAPGGKMRQVKSAAGPVDAGPTVLTMRPVFEELFAAVGAQLSDHVTLVREHLLARHWWSDGSTLDLSDDVNANAAAIQAFAGSTEAAAFLGFTKRAQSLFEGFDQPMMQAAAPSLPALAAHVLTHPSLALQMAPLSSLAQSLRRSFKDPRLRQLFGRYATYVGGAPAKVPALLSLIWASEAAGVWRVEGGIQRLAQAIADLAQARGAEFLLNAEVTKIEQQQNRASGVVLRDGTRITADAVLFNGDPKALFHGLLGDAIRPSVTPAGIKPRSLSAYVWHFAAEVHGLPLVHHNVFFADRPDSEFPEIARGVMPADPTLYLCAQDRGGDRIPQGRERFEIIMNGPPGCPEPQEEFTTCQTRTFQRLAAMGLTFSPRPGRENLTTPRDFAVRFPGSDGSLYGRSPAGMMAAFQRPTAHSRVPGLYLAGGGVHPGAGVPMACLSGRHAAEAIMRNLTSTSTSRRTDMRGGTSMGSRTTTPAQ